ncbi:unnamed protein product [Rhizoctonia solani]|uniref:Uncharacterized protein n=1 Tax=Rhizoctonia solani TaxID=456999 RepID=A0A8H3DXK4_9AGAM|nr:unnamed protein product [Rhizoctonia solani]
MSSHRIDSVPSSSRIRRGMFAYPFQAIQTKEKRCLEASRKEYPRDFPEINVGGHQIQRHTSASGMLYFLHEQFLSPNNLTNNMVFSAFLVALEELSQYFAKQSFQLGRFEVVIVLQCVSLTEPRFSYYFVDHQFRRVSDESIFLENRTDNHGTIGWNVADHNYWDHVAVFSAHRPCTAEDYDRVLRLLELQSHATVASREVQNDDTPNDPEMLRNLLSLFDRNRIDAHATASIANIMKRMLAPPPVSRPRTSTSIGSTILRSLRGIIPLGEPDKNEEYFEDDAHPAMHEDSLEV